ncbi:MAG: hypothetical protein WDO69_07760 [Pseudomonadota bacterium]
MIPLIRLARGSFALRLSSTGALACWALTISGPACSSDTARPSLVSAGGQPSAGGRSGAPSAAGGDNADLAGASGDEAGDSGAGGNGGTATELGGSGGMPPAVAPACDQMASWSAAASVSSVSAGANEMLLALTPDELDLAFVRDGALYVAHRSSINAGFSSGSALAIPAGWSATHGAALSADGRRLLLVSDPDQKKLGEWTRPSRETAFSGAIDESAFSAVNHDSDFTGKVYASPTVSARDDQLFFNSSFANASSTIVVSSRTGTESWSAPRALSGGIFDGTEGKRRLPTGISADGLTLFYFNEESAEEEARWRATSSVSSPLYDMLSLGARRGAAPNLACNRLYSASNGDVVVEKD